MTFLADFCAMILAMPRALFPAVAALAFGGGARTVGIMAAAIALGSIVAMLFSGALGRLRRQGLAVVVCVALWGLSVSGFGLAVGSAGTVLTRSSALWVGVLFLVWARLRGGDGRDGIQRGRGGHPWRYRLRPCRGRPQRMAAGLLAL